MEEHSNRGRGSGKKRRNRRGRGNAQPPNDRDIQTPTFYQQEQGASAQYSDTRASANQRGRGRQGNGRGRNQSRNAGMTFEDLAEFSQAAPSPVPDDPSYPIGAFAVPPAEEEPQIGSEGDVEDIAAELEKKVVLPARRTKELVDRPDNGGTIGNPIQLYTNHFEVKFSLGSAFQYDIKINPEGSDKKIPRELRWKIFTQLVSKHSDIFKTPQRTLLPVFDGEANFYTAAKLTLPKYRQVLKFEETGRESRNFVIVIAFACQINMAFDKYLRDHCRTFQMADALRVLDTAIKNRSWESTIHSSRHVFGAGCPTQDISDNLQIWTGHQASFRPCWKITLNLDVSFKTFFKRQTALELLAATLGFEQVPASLSRPQIKKFIDVVKGLKIKTNHLGYERKQIVKKIIDKTALTHVFENNNQRVNVRDYFRQMYNINLNYPNLPLFEVGGKGNALPMEICWIMEQVNEHKLTPRQQQEMIRASARPPHERKRMIENVMRNSNFDNDRYLKEFGITVSKQLMDIDGRVLPVPGITEMRGESGLGKYELKNVQKYNKPSDMPDFCIIAPSRSSNQGEAFHFIQELFKTARYKGLNWDANKGDFNNQLNNLRDIQKCVNHYINQGMKLLFWILPFRDASQWYKKIKYFCDGRIMSQCVQQKLVRQPRPDALQNIVLKLNIKLGGTSTTLRKEENAIYKEIFNRPFMIIGADVTHPSPSQKQMPSYAGVVASLNRGLSQYGGLLRCQISKEELIVDLQSMVTKLLKRFADGNNGRFPEKIIYYRDGVSEGQFYYVLAYELDAIQKACMNIHALDYQPAITIITVQKRHHTRFFPKDRGVGKSGNIPAGTVVDKKVVDPFYYDFFLCSHEGIQGTSRPSHYYVLYDDSNFSSDYIQLFTYHICYTYGRCARSVSYPPPTYYAHHLCMRARHYQDEYLEMTDNQSLFSGSSNSSGEEKRFRENMQSLLMGRDCSIDMDKMMYYI